MARITFNTETTLSSATLTLPENACVIIIDTDTETKAADFRINGAKSLIITDDDDVHITTTSENTETNIDSDAFAKNVIAEMLNMSNVNDVDIDVYIDDDNDDVNDNDSDIDNDINNEIDNDDNTDNDTAALTVIRNVNDGNPTYTVNINHHNTAGTYTTGIYTDATTGADIDAETIVDIITRAYENEATTSMTFNIPGRGSTTFTGNLIGGHNGQPGIFIIGAQGGAYVLNPVQELTDDMTVLTNAHFTFTGDPEVIFDGLDVNIIDDDVDDDIDNDDDIDIDDDDNDAPNDNDIANNILNDTDGQLYVTIYSRLHFLESPTVRRILKNAVKNNLSARLFVDGVSEPCVGRLQHDDNDNPDDGGYVFDDKKFGTVYIDLDDPDGEPGFTELEIYSDTNMRRRGFAGTNHRDYAEVSVAQMAEHIGTDFEG